MIGDRPILAVLPTPFTDDGQQASEVRFARAIRWHVEQGAAGFIVGAEAGEWWSLALAERKSLVEWAVREARGLPVYAFCTAMTTAATLDLAQSAQRHGASGALFTLPPLPPLTRAEADAFQGSLKRYFDLPFHFLSAEASGGGLRRADLESAGLESMAFQRQADICEALLDQALAHPASVLGASRLKVMAGSWIKWKMRLVPLFRAFGPARIGKAVFRLADLDLGSPRPPSSDLPDDVFQALRSLLAEVDSSA